MSCAIYSSHSIRQNSVSIFVKFSYSNITRKSIRNWIYRANNKSTDVTLAAQTRSVYRSGDLGWWSKGFEDSLIKLDRWNWTMNNGGCRGSPIAIMKFAGKPGLVGRHGLSTQKHLARFRNRGRAFRLSAWQANPPSFVASSHFGSSGLFDQVRGSVVRFCSFILLFFFPPLLPSRRHVSVSSKRSFDRSKIHTYVHIYVCTHLFPSFSLERRYSRFSISYRRENGIVIHRLEYHADDNYSRIQWWLQPRKRHIFGEIGRDYSRISQYFQDTRIFG